MCWFLVSCASIQVDTLQVQPRVVRLDLKGGSSPLKSYQEGIYRAATVGKGLNYKYFLVRDYEGIRNWQFYSNLITTDVELSFSAVFLTT